MASVKEAITALQAVLPSDRVTLPETEEYSTLNLSYLSGLEGDLQPACIFLPRTKEEVTTFVNVIKGFPTGSVQFAIRGGGQQPVPGCANIHGGITIDLCRLTGIEVKDGYVEIAAGERWGNVYEKLEPEGLGVTGGRSTTNGIGGLALQGGLGFYSTREGFICDNVLNFEVVLASGAIVNANAQENADLWIALRGGGNNLGIVTRFDVRTFKQGPMWGGFVWYYQPSFAGQVEALVHELTRPDASKETHLMISLAYATVFGSNDVICLNQMYYTQPVEEPPVLDPFTKMQPQKQEWNTMKLKTLVEAATEQTGAGQSQIRCAYMNITVKADAPTIQTGGQIWCDELEAIKSVPGLMCSYTLQPYAASLLEKCKANGGNSLGFDAAAYTNTDTATNESGPGSVVNVLLLTYWANSEDDERVLACIKKALGRIEENAAERKQLVPYVYWNYAFGHQDPLRGYGEEKVRGLRKASERYDPEGLFQKGCPGGFKLFA